MLRGAEAQRRRGAEAQRCRDGDFGLAPRPHLSGSAARSKRAAQPRAGTALAPGGRGSGAVAG